MSVAVVSAAAVSGAGFFWRGLLGACVGPAPVPVEVPAIAEEDEAPFGRAKKLMARAALLAAVAARRALADAGWEERREEIGYFLGVGASGGSMEDLEAMLRVSIEDGRFSMTRFAEHGVPACNPLLAFQLLNNFTLCHGAIVLGLGGPNGAFFSRGGGTVSALAEAIHAIAEGDCERALAGGADSGLHPVTMAELRRDGFAATGLRAAEGAGLLALAASAESPLAWIESCGLRSLRHRSIAEYREEAEQALPDAAVDLVVTALSFPHRALLQELVSAKWPQARIVDATAALGESLAASPALAWACALDGVAAGAERVVVVSSGLDRQLGVVSFARSLS
jgi:hypothetical protein